MIDCKEAFDEYLKQDAKACGRKSVKPSLFFDELWKFTVLLRKLEYDTNCRSGIFGRIIKKIHSISFHNLSLKLGFTFPINVFGPGLCISHYGTIVVHYGAKVGKNCKLQEGVCIGATNGSHKAATIGDNCFIGSGAKIIGEVNIADDVAIAAGAVVVKDITERGTTWGGVPAVKISESDSHSNLNKLLFIK